MSKPDDIDQDVWEVALDAAGPEHAFLAVVERIARAIMAAKAEQREADARIAEASVTAECCGKPRVLWDGNPETGETWTTGEECCGCPEVTPHYPDQIAAAIRGGHQ